MIKLAIIKNGVVDNIILADETWPEEHVILADDSQASIGYAYDGSTIIIPEAPEVFEFVQQYQTITDSATFKNKFIGAEYDRIQDSTHPIIKNIVRRFNTRNYPVDLKDDETVALLSLLVSEGLITQNRSDDLALGTPYDSGTANIQKAVIPQDVTE
jgi:hypothetical protein